MLNFKDNKRYACCACSCLPDCAFIVQSCSRLLVRPFLGTGVDLVNACTKTCAPLSDCFINNALVHFVPSCHDTCTQFVNVLDPLLVDLLHYLRLTMPSFSHKCGQATKIFHFSCEFP